MRKNTKIELSKQDKTRLFKAKCGHICNNKFNEDDVKVQDHDHRTGAFRGAAHAKCNINYYSNRYLPVVFHNVKGYDSHLIIREAYRIRENNIEIQKHGLV